jgi:uncharacterized protein
MSGERDLAILLADMVPVTVPGEFVFVCVPAGVEVDGSLATVHESEGVSHVVPRSAADAAGFAYEFVAGWITLTIHSALDAVGLTAAVSAALAAKGISCNVIAGYHHDHLLVPYNSVDRSVAILRELAAHA